MEKHFHSVESVIRLWVLREERKIREALTPFYLRNFRDNSVPPETIRIEERRSEKMSFVSESSRSLTPQESGRNQ